VFTLKTKQAIANAVQEILRQVKDDELPTGEVQFLLHVDGAEDWSWANIRNNNAENKNAPIALQQNLTV
jgi:hypothetical protein